MAKQPRVALTATYQDGSSFPFTVRITINRQQWQRAQDGSQSAQNSICIQFKQACHKHHRSAPNWVEWQRISWSQVTDLNGSDLRPYPTNPVEFEHYVLYEMDHLPQPPPLYPDEPCGCIGRLSVFH